MKFIIDIFDKYEHHFEKGGKFEKFYPAFEAFQSLTFRPRNITKEGPHVRDSLDTKRYMGMVIVALLPCILFGMYNAGYQTHLAGQLSMNFFAIMLTGALIVIPLIAVSYGVGLGIEFLTCIWRKHEVNEGFLVTGILYALILPPTIPLWQAGVGIAFAVIVAKEVFGGTGKNFLNPALTGRIFLFFAFPAYISGDAVWTKLTVAKDQLIDSWSGATAMAVAANAEKGSDVNALLAESGFTLKSLFIGLVPGSIGETSMICVLIGAAILIATGIGSWRTMLGGLIGAVLTVVLFNIISGPTNSPFLAVSPLMQLSMGSFAFAIVFMATDPVSSPALESSRFIYGFLIGVIGMIIRVINPAYPEGWMLAIIFMNCLAPYIDHLIVQSKLKKRIPNVI